MLLNLLSNAVKFMKKGEIQVHACYRHVIDEESESNRMKLEIKVTDQGIGMSSSQIEKVFTAMRSNYSDSASGMNPYGRGMGLSICKQICEGLGGTIKVKSAPRLGSTFKFTMDVFRVSEMSKDLAL